MRRRATVHRSRNYGIYLAEVPAKIADLVSASSSIWVAERWLSMSSGVAQKVGESRDIVQLAASYRRGETTSSRACLPKVSQSECFVAAQSKRRKAGFHEGFTHIVGAVSTFCVATASRLSDTLKHADIWSSK